MDTRADTTHLSHNVSGNTHLPGDFIDQAVTCKNPGCDFSGSRWEFLEHLHTLGVCWSCYGLGTIKFRAVRSYDYDCRKCGGTGRRTAPLPPRPKDATPCV